MLPRVSSGYLYDVLQVRHDSTTGEIKRQYRRLAMQLHPDRTNGRTTNEFKEIEEAHRILSDPEQRLLYNAVGRSGLKQLGDFGVPSFMRSLGVLQAGMFLMGCILSGVFVTLFLTCYKLDHPHSRLPWTLILLPLWALSPILFISAALFLCVTFVSREWGGVLQGLQLMMTGCIAAGTAAALSGFVRPFWALLPWLLFAAFGTLRHIHHLQPSVFRRHARPEDVLSPRDAGQEEDEAYNSNNNNDENVRTGSPRNVSGRDREAALHSEYCMYAMHSLFKLLCFWTFLILVLIRVLQGPTSKEHDRAGTLMDHNNVDERYYNPRGHKKLSFWVVLAPLMLYYGVQTIAMAAQALTGSLAPDNATNSTNRYDNRSAAAAAAAAATRNVNTAHTPLLPPRTNNNVNGGNERRARDESLAPTMCGRLMGALGFMVAPASMLYMAMMWAMREDYEYNGLIKGYHPSAMLATLPLLCLLALLTFMPCCVGCGIGAFSGALDNDNDAEGEDDDDANAAEESGDNGEAGVYKSKPGNMRAAKDVDEAKDEPDFRARRGNRGSNNNNNNNDRSPNASPKTMNYDSTGTTKVNVPASNKSPEAKRSIAAAAGTERSESNNNNNNNASATQTTDAPSSQSTTRTFKDRTADVD